jgi:hypothetical protein
MPIDWLLVATIGGPIITLFLGAALERVLEKRARLICFYGHVSAFNLERVGQIFTHSVVIRNTGRLAARNVRLGHHVLPDVTVSPARPYERTQVPGSGDEIVFDAVVPGDQITISYLYFPPTTWNQVNTYVRSDEGLARVISVIPTPQYPRWLLWILRVVLVVGAIAIAYALVIFAIRLYVAIAAG